MDMDDIIGNVRRCMFCKCPVDEKEVMLIPGKGVICSACVDRINIFSKRQKYKEKHECIDEVQVRNRINNISQYAHEVDIDVDSEKYEEIKVQELGGIFVPHPTLIYEQLSEYVSGQDDAKRVISIAAYNHYKRINIDEPGIEKSNVLMIGPTGSGKSLLVRTLSKIIGVPCVTISATSLTENGYIGDDVETCIELLYDAAGGDIVKTQQGIIFIDEIDKLSEVGKRNTGGNVVGRGGVQQALLKLIEGASVKVKNSRPGRLDNGVNIDTSNILFICGGAFSGIEDIVKRRINKNTSMGFGSVMATKVKSSEFGMKDVSTEDLREFGMMPEFLGRLPSVAVLDNMSSEFLIRVLKEPKNNLLWQYAKLFEFDGIELQLDDSAVEEIANLAYEEGTGCRGLRKICEKVFGKMMFELPGKNIEKVIYSAEVFKGLCEPELIIKKVEGSGK